MICSKCGKEIKDDARFCDSCGAPILDDLQMTGQNSLDTKEDEENKVIFILSYLGILFFLPLVSCPESKAGRFHANQGLVLLLTGILGQIVLSFLSTLLWRLWFLLTLISTVWGITLFALMIIGMIHASKSELKPLPVIGNFKILKGA